MLPAEFDYFRAKSLEEAIFLRGHYPGARFLAGGQSLLPIMKLRLIQPSVLIDISGIEDLHGIHKEGETLRIGALTTHAELESSELLSGHSKMLARAAHLIGDPAVRNKGTIGGNLVHADPGSDLPAVLVALGASVHLTGPTGTREIHASTFFVDLLTTALRDGEMLTAISIHDGASRNGTAYRKCEHPASGYALCGAAVVLRHGAGGDCSGVRLVFNGISPTPLDAREVSGRLLGTTLEDEILTEALSELRIDEPMSDLHASAEYRLQLARVYGKRALQAARDGT